MAEATNTRFRCHVSQTAKGLAQVDVTAEVDDPEEATRLAAVMLDETRAELKRRGYKLVDET